MEHPLKARFHALSQDFQFWPRRCADDVSQLCIVGNYYSSPETSDANTDDVVMTGVLFGTQSRPTMIPLTRWSGLICWRKADMPA